MLKSIQNPPQQFNLPKTLQFICKKTNSSKPQIDFILLQKQIGVLKSVQLKTIEQIVQFVDIHLDDFIGISDQMSNITDKVQRTQIILSLLNSKLEDHRNSFYSIENKIQSTIDKYQQGLLQSKMISLCMQETQFLMKFNKQIQIIMDKNVEQLSFIQKHLITRFCYKYQQMMNIFSHKMIQEFGTEYLNIKQILISLQGQIQLYLCQQLKRFISQRSNEKSVRNQNQNQNSHSQQSQNSQQIPKQFQIWFTYLNKTIYFYETIQQYLVSKQLTPAQKLLIANKHTILPGKSQNIINQFFEKLFQFIDHLPSNYPQKRIIQVVNKFLQKKELNFIYTYVMPVYPIAYTAYMKNLQKLTHKVKQQLRKIHRFDIKKWADIRAQNIMDRFKKDKDNDLTKWVDIIFKNNCMIDGVKTNMVKLCLQIIQKYCQKSIEQQQLTNENINKSSQLIIKIPLIIQNYILNSFMNSQQFAKKISKTVQLRLLQTFQLRMKQKINNLSKTCLSNLQNYKTLTMKVLNKKNQKQNSESGPMIINKSQMTFKPLNGYLKNNPNFTEDSINLIKMMICKEIKANYENNYEESILNYCKNNVTNEQLLKIKEYLQKQKSILFQWFQK